MPIDTTSPRSRRALLAAGLGAGAVTVATALGRPLETRAAAYNLQAEMTNVTTAGTTIQGGYFNTLTVSAFGAGASAIVATATSNANAISASADAYSALSGLANTGTGAYGYSNSGWGVDGFCNTGVGVRGSSNAATGVVGRSGATDPAAPAKTGVFGYAAQDATAVGVKGESTTGTGVRATATTGTALDVGGKAKFSRSGKATVLKTRTSTDITVTGGLTSRSVVHATLQTYRSGVAIAAVRLNYPTTGKARIYLTKVASTTSNTYVGWFVAEY